MKLLRLTYFGILGGLLLFTPLVSVKAMTLLDACRVAVNPNATAVDQATITEYDRKKIEDPSDNVCGVSGNSVACPGAYESIIINGPDKSVGCCKQVVGGTAEYSCVLFSAITSWQAAQPDATKVDIKAAQHLAQMQVDQCKKKDDVKFVPQISIPGSISLSGKEFSIKKGEGITVTSQTAAQYFAVFYRFFVAALAVIAVVMVMWGGFKRIMAAGRPDAIKSANENISGAITGVVIALISYSLLSLINPALVSLKPLTAIEPIICQELDMFEIESGEDIVVPTGMQTTMARIYGDNIINLSGEQVNNAAMLSLVRVANELKNSGVKLKIASGLRSWQVQQSLIYKNCPPGATLSSQCSPPTCLGKNGHNACPHTLGAAVDVWPIVGNTAPVEWNWCKKNRTACGENSTMQLLAKVMRSNGFCKLCSEPWHFEMPKVSSCCN